MTATVRAGAADDAATREAQARFEEGLARLKAEKFDAARLSFAQAYAVLHRPSILWNLALAEEKSGQALESLAHFKEYVRQATAEDDRARAQKHVEALMGQTGHIDIEAPASAAVAVDGVSRGVTPLVEPLDVAPGKHHVEARAPQGAKTADVDVAAGQVTHVSFVDSETPPLAAPPAPVESPAPVISAPATTPSVQAAPEASGSEFWTPRVVTVTALGGAAMVTAGLGVYFAIQSQSHASTAAGFRATSPSGACVTPTTSTAMCQEWNRAVDAQNLDATLSNAFYISGGVLAASAVATWLLWPTPSSSAAGRVTPMIGPRLAGLTAAGQF